MASRCAEVIYAAGWQAMNDQFSLPVLGRVPPQYDQRSFEDLVRNITKAIAGLQSCGKINCTTANISMLPTASTGLKAGDLWNDGGTVKVVS